MQECLAYDQVIAHVVQRIKIDLDDGSRSITPNSKG